MQFHMPNEALTPEIVTETNKKPLKMTARQIAIKSLREQGLDNATTAKSLGLSREYVRQVEKKIGKDWKGSIEKLAPQAVKNLKKLVNGETFGDLRDIKCSTAKAAIDSVLDRVSPIVKVSQSLNIHTFLDAPIELDDYK